MAGARPNSAVPSGVHWGKIDAFVEDGKLVETRAWGDDPHPTPMIEAVADAVNHPSRIRTPAVRAGWLEKGRDSDTSRRGNDSFVEVSWTEAIDLVGGEIRRIIDTHGNDAIFAGSGWGSAGQLHSPKPLFGRLFNPLGGYVAQTTNWSFGAAGIIIPRVVGTIAPVIGPMASWETLARHTDLIVMFGGAPRKNVQVNEGGMLRHRTAASLAALSVSHTEVVYLSPMRDDVGDGPRTHWLPLRPSTDAAAMLALAYTLVAENLHDAAFIDKYCVGFERFRPYLMGDTDGQPKNAAWAAPICGIAAAELEALARRMAKGRTLVTMSWSAQRADHGEQPCWLLVVLAALLGQIGLPGGGFALGYGAIDGLGQDRADVPSVSMPVAPNPVEFKIPVAKITEMLLHPGEEFNFNGKRLRYPDIRLAYWCGGNPFHHNPNLNRMLEAWRHPDTIVVQDPWWTPAARHADIVLPAATPLERNDLGASNWDNGLFAMQQAIAPLHEARTDFAIFHALAEKLGVGDVFAEQRSELEWVEQLYKTLSDRASSRQQALPSFADFWRSGRHEFAAPAQPVMPFANFRADPDAYPLKTPSGKIEIYSKTIAAFGYADCPGHAVWLEPLEWSGSAVAERYPLHLISNQPKVRLHSQLDMTALAHSQKVDGREPVAIHVRDAAARGIRDGDIVRIFNDRGACLAGARLIDTILEGVVQLSTGAWYDPVEPGRIGSLESHGSVNVLTRDGFTSQLAQSGVQQSTLVEIERYENPLPPIRAFDPPPVLPRRG